jgi:thiol-disulfide isomerase/thioredoxin
MNLFIHLLTAIWLIGTPWLSVAQSSVNSLPFNTHLICQTKAEINTVIFAMPDAVEDKDFHDFKDTIGLIRPDTSLNLYTILLYGKDIKAKKYVWVNGDDVYIYYSLKDGLQIDSIVNSPAATAIVTFDEMKAIKELNLDSLNAFLFDQLKVFYTSVFSTEIAEMIIRYNFGNFELLERLQTELEQQEPYIKNHKFSQNEKLKGILAFKDLNIGDLVLANKDSVSATIKFDTTQYTLIDFWFSACPPCLRDHKVLKKKYQQLRDKSVQIVGISNDQDFQKWKHTIDIHQHPWVNYIETDSTSKILRFASSFPSYYVLDRQGNIVKYSTRIEEILYFLGI